MPQPGIANMSQGTSYPSPTAAQPGEGPFFTSQHQMPVTEDMQIPHGHQLPHRAPPHLEERRDESPIQHRSSQELRHAQMTSPQQLAQGGLESTQYFSPASTDPAARKRSKVSRACDECRRKKIRCDANPDMHQEQCSGCKRSDSTCQFSRTPQKRGPSKGYIKELADRVSDLEGKRHMAPMAGYQYSPYNDYSPQPEDATYASRKRTHSLSEGIQNPGYMQEPIQEPIGRYPPTANMDWTGREAVRHGGHSSSNYAPNSNSEFPSPPGSRSIPPSHARPESRRDPSEPSMQMGDRQIGHTDVPFEWDEDAVDEYYRAVHTTFPLLPDSKQHLVSYLAKIADNIREAFFAALQSFGKASSPAPALTSQRPGDNSRAAMLLMTLQVEDAAARTFLENTVCLQSMLLMLIATDANTLGMNQPSVWYSLAFSMATYLNLHSSKPHSIGTEGNITSDGALARRTWLILVTLDRWHALGTSKPLIVPENGLRLASDDQTLLGVDGFHLIRLSLAVGHIANEFLCHPQLVPTDYPSATVVSRLLNGELERFRESTEPTFHMIPVVHLAYVHARIMFERHAFGYASRSGIIRLALDCVALLCADKCSRTPLIRHFASLAALTLVEALSTTKNNDSAVQGLQSLCYWLENRWNGPKATADASSGSWAVPVVKYIRSNLTRVHKPITSSESPVDRGGLQHLADAAVGDTDTVNGNRIPEDDGRALDSEPIDWTASTIKGYLNIFR